MTARTVCAVVAALSALLALGCLALSIGHSGIEVALLSTVGPGGNRAVIPAAVGLGVATVVLGGVAFGVWRQRPWAWALGIAAHSLVFLGAAVPYRGPASLAALALTGTCVALLLTRSGRAALLAR